MAFKNLVNRKVGVAIFAHNEETNIARCLESVIQSSACPELLDICVLINGTTDDTLSEVISLSSKFSQIKYIDIEMGDKSNAWNTYVYSGIDFDINHYFLDGDNWLPAYCLDKLETEFDSELYWGIAPTPIGIKETLREFMIKNKFISGNCYGLTGGFLKDIVFSRFKLPIGFIGDDSLVMYLLQEGVSSKSIVKDIKVVNTTGAVVPRLPLKFGLISFMHRRYQRYAIRHFQQEVLYYLGRKNRLCELPTFTSEFGPILREIGFKSIFVINGIQTLYQPYYYFKIAFANRK